MADRISSSFVTQRVWRGPRAQRTLAQMLRRAETPAERALWAALHAARLPVRVRRQHAIRGYIVDFYVASAALVIELDGSVHDARAEADAMRTQRLQEAKLTVLRFTNDEALHETAAVVAAIRKHLPN